MDREFFSTDNIEVIVAADLSFMIQPTSNLKSVREAIFAIQNSIDDPEYQSSTKKSRYL
jgi:transposase